jgi:hypothetical protein
MGLDEQWSQSSLGVVRRPEGIVAPPAGTLIVCDGRLKETSAMCEYA